MEPNRKVDTCRVGQRGEDLACSYLQAQGFEIRQRNWRAGHKEVDLIAVKAGFLHFVEVRALSENALMTPSETIRRRKQLRLMAAARVYMAREAVSLEAQFDVIAIVFGPKGPDDPDYKLEYIPNAFSPVL